MTAAIIVMLALLALCMAAVLREALLALFESERLAKAARSRIDKEEP